MGYREENSFTVRQESSSSVLRRHPHHRPFIVESKKFKLDRSKFLVPEDVTVAQLMYVVRKRLRLNSNEAIFFLMNNVMPIGSSLISQIYHENAADDGFCYITVTKENTFGN